MAGIPDSIRHKFKRIIEDSKGDERFKKMLAMGSDENFRWAYQLAYERAYGKAPQHIDMELNDVTGRPSREELEAAIRSIKDNPEGTGLDKGE